MTIKIKLHKDPEAELKRLLFEALPYIEADIDYNSMAECGDYERANDGRRLLNEIKEALTEEKTK